MNHNGAYNVLAGLKILNWCAVLLCCSAAIVLANSALPIPDINDFGGLARLCRLMDQRGLRECGNSNWGFAHPLINYLLTKLTNNLLWSQRTIGAISLILLCVATERLMSCKFPIPSIRARTFFLSAAVFSVPALRAVLSVHLDLIPIALTAIGVLLSGSRHWRVFLGGFLLAAGSWFRFHFALFAVLYVLLIVFFNPHQTGKSRILWVILSVATALSVPSVLVRLGLIVGTTSNLKMIVAEFLRPVSTGVSYELTFNSISYQTLLQDVDWRDVLWRHTVDLFVDPGVLLISGLVLCEVLESKFRRRTETLSGLPFVCLYLLAVLPLIFVRGLTARLESTLVLLCLPHVMQVLSVRKWGFQKVIALLTILWALSPFAAFAYLGHLRIKTTEFRETHKEVRSVLPDGACFQSPEMVANGVADYFNPCDKYWLWNPIVMGGWLARDERFQHQFGVIDLNNIEAVTFPKGLRFVILPSHPKYDFESFESAAIEKRGVVHKTGRVKVLELH